MKRKKVAFVIDEYGWAFDNITKELKKYLEKNFIIDVIEGKSYEGNIVKLLIDCKDYDLVHFLWRGYFSLIDRPEMEEYLKSINLSMEELKKTYIEEKNITCSVCDHLYLNEEEMWRTELIFSYVKNYFVTSKKLYNIYSNLPKIKKPYMIIHDGVQKEKYKYKYRSYKNRNIVVGWVGNSKFKDTENDPDLKGVNGILKPGIQDLIEEGYKIELKMADRNIKKIPQDEMPKYYNEIDIYACTSKTEGTPLPVLEAMACGIPVVSTDVGIVNEALGPIGRKFIMKKRNKEELEKYLKRLVNHKYIMRIISLENLIKIKKWSWKAIAKEYKKFINDNI